MVFTIIFTSLFVFFAYVFVADQINFFQIYKTAEMLFGSPIFYFNLQICIGLFFIVDLTFIVLHKEIYSTIVDNFRLLVKNSSDDYKEFIERITFLGNPKINEKKIFVNNFFKINNSIKKSFQGLNLNFHSKESKIFNKNLISLKSLKKNNNELINSYEEDLNEMSQDVMINNLKNENSKYNPTIILE